MAGMRGDAKCLAPLTHADGDYCEKTVPTLGVRCEDHRGVEEMVVPADEDGLPDDD